MTALALSFQNTQFDVVDRDNRPWLRMGQIAPALGYKDQRDCNKIYARNAEEFTTSMTALVELDTAGGKQQVRIFSLRGCHLLAMFARTPVAKEFRKWVLDVLDRESFGNSEPLESFEQFPEQPTRKALPGGLTLEQQDCIKALVKERAADLPKDKQAGAIIRQWSAIKKKFGCSYKEVSADNFTNVVSLLARLPLEGELLPKDQPTAPKTDHITIGLNNGQHFLSVTFEGTADERKRYVVDVCEKQMSIEVVSKSSVVADSGRLAELIGTPAGCVALKDLPAIIEAASRRIAESMAFDACCRKEARP